MSFFNEILNSENLKDADYKFKIIVLDDGLVLVQGFDKIINLSNTNISLKLSGKNILNIRGEEFVITTLARGELVARGRIGGIDFD